MGLVTVTCGPFRGWSPRTLTFHPFFPTRPSPPFLIPHAFVVPACFVSGFYCTVSDSLASCGSARLYLTIPSGTQGMQMRDGGGYLHRRHSLQERRLLKDFLVHVARAQSSSAQLCKMFQNELSVQFSQNLKGKRKHVYFIECMRSFCQCNHCISYL